MTSSFLSFASLSLFSSQNERSSSEILADLCISHRMSSADYQKIAEEIQLPAIAETLRDLGRKRELLYDELRGMTERADNGEQTIEEGVYSLYHWWIGERSSLLRKENLLLLGEMVQKTKVEIDQYHLLLLSPDCVEWGEQIRRHVQVLEQEKERTEALAEDPEVR